MKRKKLGRVKPEHLTNEEIKFSKLLVLGTKANGEKLGVLSRSEALEIAKEMGMDLVLISNNANAPVAKILDYGRYKYKKKKKQKENKVKQTIINNREVRLTPLIGIHDLNVKSRKAREFLLKGDRVKVSLKFRGRELAKKELGYQKLDEFFKTIEDIAMIQKSPMFTGGRFLDMYLVLDKNKSQKKETINKNAQNEN